MAVNPLQIILSSAAAVVSQTSGLLSGTTNPSPGKAPVNQDAWSNTVNFVGNIFGVNTQNALASDGDTLVSANGSSITNSVINNNGPDPIQGHDVGVWVYDMGSSKPVLLGQFNSIVITVKNISEAYVPIGSRQPVYFDGELQIAFTLEKGLLDLEVFRHTFGFKKLDYRNRYTRSPRFRIAFHSDPVDWTVLDEDSKQFGALIKRYPSGRFVLDECKIDSWHLGAQAGKQVVATQWQGVAQSILAETHVLRSTRTDKESVSMQSLNSTGHFEDDGNPKDLSNVPTFGYNRGTSESYGAQATTKYSDHPKSNAALNYLNVSISPPAAKSTASADILNFAEPDATTGRPSTGSTPLSPLAELSAIKASILALEAEKAGIYASIVNFPSRSQASRLANIGTKIKGLNKKIEELNINPKSTLPYSYNTEAAARTTSTAVYSYNNTAATQTRSGSEFSRNFYTRATQTFSTASYSYNNTFAAQTKSTSEISRYFDTISAYNNFVPSDLPYSYNTDSVTQPVSRSRFTQNFLIAALSNKPPASTAI